MIANGELFAKIFKFNNSINKIHSEEIQDTYKRSSWRLADRTCYENQSLICSAAIIL